MFKRIILTITLLLFMIPSSSNAQWCFGDAECNGELGCWGYLMATACTNATIEYCCNTTELRCCDTLIYKCEQQYYCQVQLSCPSHMECLSFGCTSCR